MRFRLCPALNALVPIVALVALVALVAMPAFAQQVRGEVRGEVRDSSNGQTVAGAIVMVLDSAGKTLARNITNEAGRYSVAAPATSKRLRALRIGFKPREIVLTGVNASVNIALTPIPTFLEAVSITATAGCPVRVDRAQALALYEQARSGLLATVVAREANPARVVLYGYERTMDGTSDRITRHTVRVDSSARATVSYSAVQNAQEFVKNGFVVQTAAGRTFLAPDADILLSDAFASGYCFAIAKPSSERPNQLGLAFEAADRKRDRVDIAGALWIDTAARALRRLEFQYVGLGRRMEMHEPGGSIEFREMPNGAVLVDRWKLRLIGVLSDTVAFKKTEVGPNSSTVLVRQYAAESGGELANARWRDGREWHAQLGQLLVQATDAAGKPAVGTWLMLDDTPYRARVDSNGLATFVDIVPGPYSLAVDDPALARIERTNPTNVHYTATRDSTHRAALRAPTAGDFIYQRCVADKRYSLQDSTRFLVRAMTYTGEPIGNVSWRVARRLGPGADNASSQALITAGGHLPEVVPSSVGPGVTLGAWKVVRDGGRTGTDGMFQICIGGLGRGARLLIQTSTPGFEDKSVEVTLTDALQVIRLNLAPKP